MVHNMKLNPIQCKEILMNFLHNPKYLLRPITIGNNVIDRVTSYKSWEFLNSNLKWNTHVDYNCL